MICTFADTDPTALAALFTRPSFEKISSFADPQNLITEIFGEEKLFESRGLLVGEVFDQAWQRLKDSYRNEYVYKTELANRIIFGRHSPNTAALHVELPISDSIADMAVYNGTSTAYEIKTDLDSFSRLRSQSDNYIKAFDKVYVVVSEKNVSRYLKNIDARVGILSLSKKGSLREEKSARSNIDLLDHEVVFRCLRKSEQIQVAETVLGEKLNLPNGVIFEECLDAFKRLDAESAHALYVQKMRARKTDKKTQKFVLSLPYSLRALGYASSISERKRSFTLEMLDKIIL